MIAGWLVMMIALAAGENTPMPPAAPQCDRVAVTNADGAIAYFNCRY